MLISVDQFFIVFEDFFLGEITKLWNKCTHWRISFLHEENMNYSKERQLLHCMLSTPWSTCFDVDLYYMDGGVHLCISTVFTHWFETSLWGNYCTEHIQMLLGFARPCFHVKLGLYRRHMFVPLNSSKSFQAKTLSFHNISMNFKDVHVAFNF